VVLGRGEIFGLSPDDFDFDDGWLAIRRQVKRVGYRMVFGLPKNDKERRVPLPGSVTDVMRAHLKAFPPVPMTLPWENPRRGHLVTVPLVFTTTHRTVIRGNVFGAVVWHPALRRPVWRSAGSTACTRSGTSTRQRCWMPARASRLSRNGWATRAPLSRCGSMPT
jgi:integrase